MWDLIASVPDHCLSFYFEAVCLLFFSDFLNQHYFFVIFQTAQQLKEQLFKSALLFYNISDGAAIQGSIDYLSSIPGTMQVKIRECEKWRILKF